MFGDETTIGQERCRQPPTKPDPVDIITCDDEARITEFKVLILPLQAVNLVHAQMKATLERLAAG